MPFQVGKPRSSTESLQVLREQISLACRGVRAPIDTLQTSTGVKDAITQHWIEDLLARHRSMKVEGLPLPDIQRTLEQWVAENGSGIYNEHLTTRGTVLHVSSRNLPSLTFSRI